MVPLMMAADGPDGNGILAPDRLQGDVSRRAATKHSCIDRFFMLEKI